MVNRLRSNDDCWCGSHKKLKRCHGDHAAVRRPPVIPGDVSQVRTVPANITPPPYVLGEPIVRDELQIMTGSMIDRLRHAGQVAAEVLIETGAAVGAGATTDELDAIAHQAYIDRGAYPSTLGYRGFSKSLCTSVNEVICHGIPDNRQLVDGDIVNIDITAFIDGVHGDTSATFAVGSLDTATDALVATTCLATYRGISAIAPGRQLKEIGRAIEACASPRGFGVVRDYGGHGIGEIFHAGPHINHVEQRDDTMAFVPGLTFTVEPMITAGTHLHDLWDDDWTVVTEDLLPSAQFEHTVIVTDDGVEILTVTADGRTAVAWPNSEPATPPNWV